MLHRNVSWPRKQFMLASQYARNERRDGETSDSKKLLLCPDLATELKWRLQLVRCNLAST